MISSKVQELTEENVQLQQLTRDVLHETSGMNATVDSDYEEFHSGENSLSEQLVNNATTRALKLEVENAKLLSTIESMKEQNFHESSKKILELEKEKKRLALKNEQMQENCSRLNGQCSELEKLFKDTMQENQKQQEAFNSVRVASDRVQQELQNERTKVTDLQKNIESLTNEKQRIQFLCDAVRKRGDETEKSLNALTEQLAVIQVEADLCKEVKATADEFRTRIGGLEKENLSLQKEIVKFKNLNEVNVHLLFSVKRYLEYSFF